VSPIVDPGESVQQAQERLREVLQDSDMALAMRMNHPERLRLRWELDA
jgi:hypothetical protein